MLRSSTPSWPNFVRRGLLGMNMSVLAVTLNALTTFPHRSKAFGAMLGDLVCRYTLPGPCAGKLAVVLHAAGELEVHHGVPAVRSKALELARHALGRFNAHQLALVLTGILALDAGDDAFYTDAVAVFCAMNLRVHAPRGKLLPSNVLPD